MNENEKLLTIDEFATSLRVKSSCIRRWIAEGRVTVIKVGRLTRLSSAELSRVIREGTRHAKQS
jgi:excisionase family DNA binding protein